jgi:hypothetical protein
MSPILANAGVPMILPQLYLMGLALIPIVLLESAFLCRVPSVNFLEAAKGLTIANLASTIIGIPIAWSLMLGLQLITTGGYPLGMNTPLSMLASVTLQAAWLDSDERHLYWMLPAAVTTLLLPSFAISVLIERFCLLRRWRHLERTLVSRWVVRANVYSYLVLFVLSSAWFSLEVSSRPLGERLPKPGAAPTPVQQSK